MAKICPLCNGLLNIELPCKECGQPMVEQGPLDSYLGPYSPYQDQQLLELNNGLKVAGTDPCIHLFYCRECQLDHRCIINKVEI